MTDAASREQRDRAEAIGLLVEARGHVAHTMRWSAETRAFRCVPECFRCKIEQFLLGVMSSIEVYPNGRG